MTHSSPKTRSVVFLKFLVTIDPSVGLKKRRFLSTVPFPLLYTIFDKKGTICTPFIYAEPLLPLCFLIHISKRKNCSISFNCSKRSHLFNMNKIAKTGDCWGIFTAIRCLFSKNLKESSFKAKLKKVYPFIYYHSEIS